MFSNILHPVRLEKLAKCWLLEDASHLDFGSSAIESDRSEFVIYMKSPGILAGSPFCDAVFKILGLSPEWLFKDGTFVDSFKEIAVVQGPCNKLLLSERVVLNVLSRASGVATEAFRMRSKLRNLGWDGILAGSRKTTPGFRMVEKYSLLVGGADMHRYDLSSMVMLKDNHVCMAGSVKQAIEAAKKVCGFSMKIEVECRSLQEAREAAQCKCDIIMLDNFSSEDLKEAACTLKKEYPTVLLEASGGINMNNIQDYAHESVDIISSSSLVQGYPTLDFSMKFNKKITI